MNFRVRGKSSTEDASGRIVHRYSCTSERSQKVDVQITDITERGVVGEELFIGDEIVISIVSLVKRPGSS